MKFSTLDGLSSTVWPFFKVISGELRITVARSDGFEAADEEDAFEVQETESSTDNTDQVTRVNVFFTFHLL